MSGTRKRGLIMEGRMGAFVPTSAYVRQGDRVHVFYGNDQLHESFNADQLVESVDQMELEERTLTGGKTVKVVKGGKYVMEGVFQRSDVKNANGRVYGRKIWERLLEDTKSPVMESVKDRSMIGHLEHPKDGRTDGNLGALVVTDLKLQEDGVVWGRLELLDTEQGLRLQEYTNKKVKWGVSSRGMGSVDDTGHVNEEDYSLETFDAVMRPSTPGAHPERVNEGDEDENNPKGEPEGEGKKPNDTPGTNEGREEGAGVPPDVAVILRRCVSLSETKTTDLNPDQRASLHRRLVSAVSHVNRLAASKDLPLSESVKVQERLINKLSEFDLGAMTAATPLEESAGSGNGGESDERDEAFRKSVRAFRTQIDGLSEANSDLTETNEALQMMLADAEEQLTTLRAQVSDSEGLRESLEETKGQLEVAYAVIADQSAETIGEDVRDAVDEAIDQNPDLERHAALLEQATSVDQVQALVEDFMQREPVTPEPAHAGRRLPRGSVMSESVAPSRGGERTSNPGARMAAAALAGTRKG